MLLYARLQSCFVFENGMIYPGFFFCDPAGKNRRCAAETAEIRCCIISTKYFSSTLRTPEYSNIILNTFLCIMFFAYFIWIEAITTVITFQLLRWYIKYQSSSATRTLIHMVIPLHTSYKSLIYLYSINITNIIISYISTFFALSVISL